MSSTPETPTLSLTLKPHGRHDCSLVNTYFICLIRFVSSHTHTLAKSVCIHARMYPWLQFLDPYDGSSEDSDESNLSAPGRRTRRGKGAGGGRCRTLGRNRRFFLLKSGSRDPATEQHLLDVQMTCESESELWLCEIDIRASDGGGDLEEPPALAHTIDVELLDDSGVYAPQPSTVGPGNSPRVPHSSSERSPSPCHLQCLYKRKMCFPGAEVSEVGQRKRQCVLSMEEEHEEGGSASEPGLSHVNTDWLGNPN